MKRDDLVYIKNILKASNANKVDFDLLDNVFTVIEHDPERKDDLLDSFSSNQFKSKDNLINHVKNLNILNKDSEITIFGSWYGSILIPSFCDDVKRITAIDLDTKVISIAKNRLFSHYKNIEFIAKDCFAWAEHSSRIRKTQLIINTSCEHMKPMRDLKVYNKYNKLIQIDAYFAFQSNNMFDIAGHINCVNSIEEFKSQLPDRAKVLIEDEVTDDRGTRYTLIGKL
jgi:hypothetical protein